MRKEIDSIAICKECGYSEYQVKEGRNKWLWCNKKLNWCIGVMWTCNRVPSIWSRLVKTKKEVMEVNETFYNKLKGGSSMSDIYEVGQKVTVDGVTGYIIVKVMKSSAKVKKDGKISLKPFAFIEAVKGSKPASGSSRKRTEEKKESSRKRPSYTKSHDDNGEDDSSAADDVQSAPKPKKKKGGISDDVSKLLTNAGTHTKMIDAVRKHKAYGDINTDAFKRVVAQKNKIGEGLIRMRLGNLLRGAVNRGRKK